MQHIKSSFDQYRDGGWVHYSKLPQLTINPKQFHQDPAGIYLFPEAFETEGGWHRYPYRIHVNLKPNLKVLDIGELNLDNINDLLEKLGFGDMIGDEYLRKDREPRENQRRFWEILRQRLMSEPGRFNKIFRRLGYDAIFDDARVIHSAEHQLIVLNPRKVEVTSIEQQKASGFEEINKVLDLIAKKLGSLGEIELERPKKVKSWGEQNLQGAVTIRDPNDKNRYVHIMVQPWFVQKEDKTPEALSVTIKDSGNQDRTYSVSLKFRDFKNELNRLFDPKEDLMRRVKKVFGKETVSQLFPILVPQEPGVPWPGGFDNFAGPPFGKIQYDNHPMYSDPEVFLRAPSEPVRDFVRDITPILSAFSQKPLVEIDQDLIDIEIEGKGILHARSLTNPEWEFEGLSEKKLPYQKVVLIENVEVEPKFRREGVGTSLVKALIETAKKIKTDAILLIAIPHGDNALDAKSIEAFYRSLGFKVWEDHDKKIMLMDLAGETTSVYDYNYHWRDTDGIKPTEWTKGPSAPARLAKDPWGANMGFTAGLKGDWEAEGYEISDAGPVDFEGADDGEAEEFLKENPDLRPHDYTVETADGESVGSARIGLTLDRKNIYVWDINIEPEHRRKGLASEIYRRAEKQFGKKLRPGVSGLSEDSKALWNQPNRSFGTAVEAHLTKRHNKNTNREEWALVSESDPSKILKWFGTQKPSDKAVKKEERRIQYFKHQSGSVEKFKGQPNRSFGSQSKWPKKLNNEREIADYIEEHAPDYIDREMIEELLRGTTATLKKIPLDSVSPGPEDQNVPNKAREKKYLKMDLETMPPIVVDADHTVLDGNHRRRVAEALKLEEIWAYVLDTAIFSSTITSSSMSIIPENVQNALINWLNGSYDPSDIRAILKYEWPERFKTVPKRIYRGEPLREEDLERLNNETQTAYGLSWTSRLRTAEGFAIQNDGDYGVTYWYEPKPEEVIVNLDTVMQELNLKTKYASEQEILLSRNVPLRWENVETILWSEHTEQAGEEIPRDRWEMLLEKYKNPT